MAKQTVFTDDNIKNMVGVVVSDPEYVGLIEDIKNLTPYEKDCVIAFILGLCMKNALTISNEQKK